ncbi:GntR family transcriptional regulator [Agrobacterium rhizogenes]|jgi:DNA-binding GntR family transcriptional regulator|uniref:GntR family transcriptional regulator n=2 Tax=unclassified Rhizobium TaxID=2613769 RepID=A0AAU7SKJ6_9HYPH|nr:GntR family transcriptional regulator [Rhizobium rhizogenes]NTJ80194.1 GntR family transcriptional regulator [Rhizobium rhizogenes]
MPAACESDGGDRGEFEREKIDSAMMKKEKQPRSLSEEAYDRLESMIVSTELLPGARYTIQQLQQQSGLGRTPVHDAVKRLSANQLIHVSPRSGLHIAPVNLSQERTLLPLRTEMEAIACGLASERATPQDHKILRTFITDLEASKADLSLERFNVTDRLLNRAILTASGEPLLANTLIPLQTLYRRTGWIYHTYLGPGAPMETTVESHISLLRFIVSGDRARTEKFVREMMEDLGNMLLKVRQSIDPATLDVSLADMAVRTGVAGPID